MALSEKILNSRDVARYRKENGGGVVLVGPTGSGPPPKVFPSEVVPSFTYGKQTRPSTPIAAVISNQFAAEYEQAIDENYQLYEKEKLEVRHTGIKTTKASEGHSLARQK